MANHKCPKCGGRVKRIEPKLYRCNACKMNTDCIDDGTVGKGRPDRNAESKEEFELREAARRSRPRYR